MKKSLSDNGHQYSSLASSQAAFKTAIMLLNLIVVVLLILVYCAGYLQGKSETENAQRKKQEGYKAGLPSIPNFHDN